MSKFTIPLFILATFAAVDYLVFPLVAASKPLPLRPPQLKLLPGNVSEIEEMQNWNKDCRRFTDGFPKATCNPDMVTLDKQVKKSGGYSLRMQGTKTLRNTYTITLPIRGGTKYKLSVWIKIEDRACYNYLDLNYPSFYTTATPSIRTFVQGTKGIWCGLYSMEVNEPGARPFTLLQPISFDALFISYSDVDWFNEDSYFQTSKRATSVTISISLQGFDGKIWIDGLTLREVESIIEDKYLHIPIAYEFQGMKIKQVSQNPLFIETNAAKFIFSDNQIEFQKGGETIGNITFSSPTFLRQLQVTKEQGVVILENTNVIMSVGADSTLITKLKKEAALLIEGKKPKYKAFEAGLIFATDYSKGFLFSQVYPHQIIRTMPFSYNASTVDYSYNDADFTKLGIKNWHVLANFSQNPWQIRYDFKKGDGFIASIFPPKEFDENKYCKERLNGEPFFLNLNVNPQLNPAYFIQKFSEHHNIMLLGSPQFAVSINDQNPPIYYYLKDGRPVSPTTPNATAVPLIPLDPAGPLAVKEEQALHNFVNQAHQQGVKVIVYVAPANFYTVNIDVLLNNLKGIIDQFNVDGVYYDGLILHSPLKSLELVRKTRNILKGKFFVLHHSWQSALIRRSDHFRAPFYDAYADQIWLGEGMKKTDQNTWRLNYANQNVSNTISVLLPELRPIDYALTPEENKKLSLPPEQQIDKQLAYKGQFRITPFSHKSFIGDTKLFETSVSFDPRYYWNKLDNFCLAVTCGDNICDTGETIYTCAEDCAPETEEAVLSRDNSNYVCTTNHSIAQWMIDGKPFYQLHFTFDDEIARDDSENKMNPRQDIGLSKSLNSPPEPAHIGNRKAFYFNGSTSLSGVYNETLDFTNKNFSIFSAIKKDKPDSALQVIFALNQNIYYGIHESKLFVSLIDNIGVQRTFHGTSIIDQNWHTIGVIYKKPKLKLYVDGKEETTIDITLDKFLPFGTYSIGALGPSDNRFNFRGYIDDLFVKNTELTEEQVMQYHATLHKTIALSGNARCIINKDGRKYTAMIMLSAATPSLQGDVVID